MASILTFLLAVLVVEGITAKYLQSKIAALHDDCAKIRDSTRTTRRELLSMVNAVRELAMKARGYPVIRVRYLPMDEEIVIMHPNISMLNCAWENGIGIPTACLGNARCGTCKVRIIEPKDKMPAKAAQEKITLSMFTRDENIRLSCMIKPRENMTVGIESEQALIDTVLSFPVV